MYIRSGLEEEYSYLYKIHIPILKNLIKEGEGNTHSNFGWPIPPVHHIHIHTILQNPVFNNHIHTTSKPSIQY